MTKNDKRGSVLNATPQEGERGKRNRRTRSYNLDQLKRKGFEKRTAKWKAQEGAHRGKIKKKKEKWGRRQAPRPPDSFRREDL